MNKEVRYVDWAFQKGRLAGREGKTTEKTLMKIGLGCAAESQDEINAQNWLNGFEYGEQEVKREQEAVRAANQTAWERGA